MSSIQAQKNAKIAADILAQASGQAVAQPIAEKVANKITIRDKVYSIKELEAYDGLDTWEYILQRILPAVGTGLDAMQQQDEFMESTTMTEAMMHLSNKLEGETFKMLSTTLFEGATVDGEPLNPNVHFKANYGVWRKLFAHALKVNFASFFDEGWSAGLKDLMTMVSPQLTKSPQE